MDRVHIYTYTDILGPRKRQGYYAWRLRTETAKGPAELCGVERVEEPETENRVQLLAVIKALRRLTRSCSLVIFTHSGYAAAGISRGWVERWTENGWINGKGGPVANRAEWEEMAELLNVHEFEFRKGWHAYSERMKQEIEEEKKRLRIQ